MTGLCTWCGHRPHDDACPREIQTGSTKRNRVMQPCPCRRHKHEQGKPSHE